MNQYDRGDLSRISAAFVNAAGVATDPTEVVLRVAPPTETVLVYRWPTPGVGEGSIVDDAGAGAFHVDVNITESGHWTYRWSGAGTVQSAEEASLYARHSAF